MKYLDLLRWETARPEIDLFGLLFGYFFVRSADTNSKISLNHPKNLKFRGSAAPIVISLIFFACTLLVSCTASRPLIPKNQYDEQVNFYSKKVNPGKKSKIKHLKGLETAYQNANTLDKILSDSMLAMGEAAQWPYINHVHRRMRLRDQKMASLLPLMSKEGFTPRLELNPGMDSLEYQSRVNAAGFLYHSAVTLLDRAQNEDRLLARQSYTILDNLKRNYFPDWEQTDSLLRVSRDWGTTWFLTDAHGVSYLSPSFWQYFFQFSNNLGDPFWQRFDVQPQPGRHYHYFIELDLAMLNMGFDNQSTTCNSISKEVVDGETVKKDSSGNVIERTPIYKTVTATVTTTTLSKSSDATLHITVINNENGTVLYTNTLYDSHYFEATSCTVYGDSRAAEDISCYSTVLISPSDWDVTRELARQLNRRTCSDLWSVVTSW